MKKIFTCIIFLLIMESCKEKYLPSISSPTTGYLVVEGFISSGQEPTKITLTRTTKLFDSVNIIYEHNAQVNIESENHQTFPLFETGTGEYVSSPLNLNRNEKYHLQIKTQDGKLYASDFAKVKGTPDIDSISWTRENGGVKFYINTHDPQNNTRYYQWKYEETWEFHAAYETSLIYIYDPITNRPIGVVYRNPDHSSDTTIFKCWQTVNSTNITLGSSEKLSQDLIYLPLLYIEPGSVKLSVLYSINVRQYALSKDAYLFFQKIKKNTEQLGSLFDPQPSELKGNIHCITRPDEIVVGYIDISEEKVQRIFIGKDQLPGWNYRTNCTQMILDNDPDSLLKHGGGWPTNVASTMGFAIIQFYATDYETCIDCTLSGTNVRPAFWP